MGQQENRCGVEGQLGRLPSRVEGMTGSDRRGWRACRWGQRAGSRERRHARTRGTGWLPPPTSLPPPPAAPGVLAATQAARDQPQAPTAHQVFLQGEQRVGVAEVVDVAGLCNLHKVLAGAACAWGEEGNNAHVCGQRVGKLVIAGCSGERRAGRRRIQACARLPNPTGARPVGTLTRTLAVAGGAPRGHVTGLHQVEHDVLH